MASKDSPLLHGVALEILLPRTVERWMVMIQCCCAAVTFPLYRNRLSAQLVLRQLVKGPQRTLAGAERIRCQGDSRLQHEG